MRRNQKQRISGSIDLQQWTARQQEIWRVRTESRTSFQDPWSRSRKWPQKPFCV